MLSRMKLLPLYGLVLLGLVQCTFAAIVISPRPPQDLIVAPEPEDAEDDEEDDEIKIQLKNLGVFYNDIDLCSNIASNTFLPFVGKCTQYIECIDEEISGVGDCYNDPEYVKNLCKDEPNCELRFDYRYQACSRVTEDYNVACMPKCEENVLSSFCYDRTCTKYVLCYFGMPVLRECLDNLQYNAETDRCDFPQYVDCVDNECSFEKTPKNITYVASKAHCDKYFICSDGMAFSQECAKGLYYNPESKHCEVMSKVDCKITAEQRNIKPFSRSPPQRADIICPDNGIHFFAHKRRRDAYYYCVQGNGITLDCTPGLFYDTAAHECREPKYIA